MITEEKINAAEKMWQDTTHEMLQLPQTEYTSVMLACMANPRLLLDIMELLKESR